MSRRINKIDFQPSNPANVEKMVGEFINKIRTTPSLQAEFELEWRVHLPNLSKDQVAMILQYFKADGNYLPAKISKSTVSRMEHADRKLQDQQFRIVTDVSTQKSTFMTKKKLLCHDLQLAPKLDMRLCLSTEKILSRDAYLKNTFNPDKTSKISRSRAIVAHKELFNGKPIFESHITEVTDSQDKVEYQIEFEINRFDLRTIMEPINIILAVFGVGANAGGRPGAKSKCPEISLKLNNQLKINVGNDLFQLGKSVNKPRDLNYSDEQLKRLKDYAVTYKLDGERVLAYVVKNQIWIINDSRCEILSENTPNFPEATILDAEFYKDKIYIFDVLFIGKDDVRMNNLNYRLQQIHNFAASPKIATKLHFYSGNPYLDTQAAHKNALELEFEIDGIIYTPIYGGYMTPVFKYKPKKLLTIDFAVEAPYENTRNIQVYQKNEELVNFPGKIFFKEPYMPDDRSKTRLIFECQFDPVNNYFVPMRVRFDKVLPNYIGVAATIKNLIDSRDYPVEVENLLVKLQALQRSDPLASCFDFHNNRKRFLLNSFLNYEKVILDLGAGNGGEIDKYVKNRASKVFAVEPNQAHIDEYAKRLGENRILTVKLIKEPAENTDKIMAQVDSPIDVVTSFFSLTFFMDSEAHLDNFFTTVTSKLKAGGLFMGTVMDGEKAMDLNNSLVNISKGTVENNKFGQKIKIKIAGKSIVEQEEYLVFWDLLEKTAKKHQLNLIETSLFTPPEEFTSEQKAFSGANRWFVFKFAPKERHVPARKPVAILPERSSRGEIPVVADKPVTATKKPLATGRIMADNQHQHYPLPITNEWVLLRTGSIADGDCFFHSLLRAVSIKYAKNTSKIQRSQMVNSLRKQLSDKLTIEKWMALNDGQYALNKVLILFSTNNSFHRALKKKCPNLADMDLGEFINQVYAKSKPENLPEFIEALVSAIEDLCGKATGAIESVKNAPGEIFKTFKNAIEKKQEYVQQDHISYLGDELNRDIYIIDGETKTIYRGLDNVRGDRLSLVFLYVRGDPADKVERGHYEALGRLSEGNLVQREFDPEDPLIMELKQQI